jgi:cell division protein ZapD
LGLGVIHYEYPFNERIRTLLRLEDLFDRAISFTARESASDHDVAVRTLLDILDVAARADLKMDLIQELERQRQVLVAYRNNPNISESALSSVIQEVEVVSASLLSMAGKFGQPLRENEWLMAVKGRISIPGGLCEFDLPGYHFWLHRNVDRRRQNLQEWFQPLKPVHDALGIILRLLRSSGVAKEFLANNGQYHQAMTNGAGMQMALVSVDETQMFVPEVSANRFALNIRFVSAEQNAESRSKPTQTTVPFRLTLCSL